MNSITRTQFTALLIVSDLFSLMCFHGSLSVYTAIGFLTGTAVQFLLALPFAAKTEQGAKMPKWLKLAFTAMLIMWGALLVRRMWRASDVTFVPYETADGIWGRIVMTSVTAAVCLYISSTGIKAAARSAVIAVFSGIVFLAADMISAVISLNTHNIAASADSSTIYDGLILSFTSGGSLIAFIVLLPLVSGKKRSALLMYFICRGILCTAVIITAVIVAGGIMDIADFPVIMSAQLSQPFASQRIDALFLMLFAVFGVFALTSHIMTAAYLIREAVPKFRRWRSTSMLLLTILASLFLTGCASTGLVHDKRYVRYAGFGGGRLTLAFFSDDDIITAEGEDIRSALKNAELQTGKPIVTGFAEMVMTDKNNSRDILADMLKEWKVSPSCMAVYSNDPEYTMKNSDLPLLEGRLKEEVKQGKAHKCDIVTVLSNMQ